MDPVALMVTTGEYIIHFYNRYGARLKGSKKGSESHMKAICKAEKLLLKQKGAGEARAFSYTIDRRVYNSLNKHEDYT